MEAESCKDRHQTASGQSELPCRTRDGTEPRQLLSPSRHQDTCLRSAARARALSHISARGMRALPSRRNEARTRPPQLANVRCTTFGCLSPSMPASLSCLTSYGIFLFRDQRASPMAHLQNQTRNRFSATGTQVTASGKLKQIEQRNQAATLMGLHPLL